MGRTKITAEDVLKFSDGGRTIFEQELGRVGKKIPSPLRNDGKTPSFEVKQSGSGKWYGTDYGGDNWSGDAIEFIKERYRLTFEEAVEKIANDLGMKESKKVYKTLEKTFDKVFKEPKTKTVDFTDCRFTDKHKRYMDRLEIPEDWLNQNDLWAVDKWAIDKKAQRFTENEYCFAYVHRDLEGKETGGVKILRLGPNVEDKYKWFTSVPNNKLWRTHLIKESTSDFLFVIKSFKDGLLLNYHFGLTTVPTQNESATILLENNYDFLESIDKKKVVCYGSDFQGWHESYLITHLTGWGYFNTPNNVYNIAQLEDVSDYYAAFGKNSLQRLLKNKKFI